MSGLKDSFMASFDIARILIAQALLWKLKHIRNKMLASYDWKWRKELSEEQDTKVL